jgi:hypothetical protein
MAVTIHPRAWLDRRSARATADYWSVLGELCGSKVPGAAPLRIAALRPHIAILGLIVERLRDDEPVTLYAEVDDVQASLRAVLDLPEVR